jgi:hypothetical protein
MSTPLIGRRDFLTLPLALLLSPLARVGAEAVLRRGRYAADVGVLYDMLTFHLEGTIEESIDRATGQYHVVIAGDGASISNRVESWGLLREGRWTPARGRSWFKVRGRLSRTEIDYDYGQRTIAYRARSETFFLRRLRIVEDVVAVPPEIHVDDVVSAILNYADGLWSPRDGALRTFVVRRRHAADEGPDDVATGYRAELASLEAKVAPDPENGKSSAVFDLSPFSSWMRPSRPARIVFGTNRRPELITSSMILGSSLTIRLGSA